jgi:hypothetical protein
MGVLTPGPPRLYAHLTANGKQVTNDKAATRTAFLVSTS